MAQRDNAYSRFLLLKEVGREVEEAWRSYKTCRNIFVKYWRDAKQKYFEESFVRLKNEPKKLWKYLKSLYKTKDKQMKYVDFDGECVYNSDNVANRLNEYYVNSIEEIVTNIPSVNDYIFGSGNSINSLDSFNEVNSLNIRRIIKNLKGTNGPDMISSEVLKKTWIVIGDKITQIVHESILQRKLPQSLKTSVVIPIAKIKGSVKCSDLRPINTLPVIEKVIETVVYETLMEHIRKYDLLSENQSGFREQHSTETALQLVIEDWLRAKDRDEGIVAVYLDYRRAFETIDRKLLLKKLKYMYKIDGNVYQWLEDYLQLRYQKVKFNDGISETRQIVFGVPQGSKLGPLLFILYINDLPGIMRRCKIHLFADDTLMYYYGNNAEEAVRIVDSELALVYEWLSKNSLSVNVVKTKCMVMGKTNFKEEAELRQKITLKDSPLEWVRRYKYLGVVIDSCLTFKEHVEYINNKIAKKVNLLHKLRKVLSRAGKELLFKLIVMPHLRYCSTILTMVTKHDIANLQKNFNKGMRAVLNKRRRESINSMLKELGYLTIEKEVKRDVLTFVYRLDNGLLPKYLDGLVQKNSDIHQYRTRQAENFYVETVNSSRVLKSVFHRGLTIYNKLPQRVKQSRSIGAFRKNVGIWLEDERLEN